MVIPATRLKFYRRISALKEHVGDDTILAERIVQSTLYAWQQQSFENLLPPRIPYGCKPYITESTVKEFADWLASQPFNEAAYWLASAYAILVGEDMRTERALFFTPPILSERVIDHLVAQGASLSNQHWHDPACGGAAFLVPIAKRMSQELARQGLSPTQQLQRISKNVSGNDLDPFLLYLSRAFIEMALYQLIQESGYRPDLNLRQGDGLIPTEDDAKPDVIALNPPYRKINSSEATRYRPAHGDVIERQPNIYGLFINRSLQIVRPEGLIGLLTPTSFLSGQSFSKLRKKLIKQAEVRQIDMLSDRSAMFIDVQQETAITILRHGKKTKRVTSKTQINILDSKGNFSPIGKYPLPSSGRPWPIPRTRMDAEWLRLAEAHVTRLDEYGYKAKIGHLVAYRDDRNRFSSLPSGPGESQMRVVPLIWATDIAPSGVFEHNRLTKYDRTEHFVEVKSLQDSSVIKKPSVIMQRLTSSDQRSRLVAAAIPQSFLDKYGGFVCENHVIVLEPLREDAQEPELLAQLLNTSCVDSVFRCISGSSNVSVFELNELLLPPPTHLQKRYTELGSMELAAKAAYQDGYTLPRTRKVAKKPKLSKSKMVALKTPPND